MRRKIKIKKVKSREVENLYEVTQNQYSLTYYETSEGYKYKKDYDNIKDYLTDMMSDEVIGRHIVRIVDLLYNPNTSNVSKEDVKKDFLSYIEEEGTKEIFNEIRDWAYSSLDTINKMVALSQLIGVPYETGLVYPDQGSFVEYIIVDTDQNLKRIEITEELLHLYILGYQYSFLMEDLEGKVYQFGPYWKSDWNTVLDWLHEDIPAEYNVSREELETLID